MCFRKKATGHFKLGSDSCPNSSSFQDSHLLSLNNEGEDDRAMLWSLFYYWCHVPICPPSCLCFPWPWSSGEAQKERRSTWRLRPYFIFWTFDKHLVFLLCSFFPSRKPSSWSCFNLLAKTSSLAHFRCAKEKYIVSSVFAQYQSLIW